MSIAVEFPTFQPALRIISAITKAYPAAVTTDTDHDFISGLIVRLTFPEGYGMTQINDRIGVVTVTAATTFTIDIDTRLSDLFIAAPGSPYDDQSPQVIPIGEVSRLLTSATQNVLPY